jgi:hypothetical protein
MCYCGNVYCLKLIERGVCKVRKDKAKEERYSSFSAEEVNNNIEVECNSIQPSK